MSGSLWEAILCQYGKVGRLKTQLQLSFPLDSPHWLFPPLEGCWDSNRDHGFCPPQACLTGLSYGFIRESTKLRLLKWRSFQSCFYLLAGSQVTIETHSSGPTTPLVHLAEKAHRIQSPGKVSLNWKHILSSFWIAPKASWAEGVSFRRN